MTSESGTAPYAASACGVRNSTHEQKARGNSACDSLVAFDGAWPRRFKAQALPSSAAITSQCFLRPGSSQVRP